MLQRKILSRKKHGFYLINMLISSKVCIKKTKTHEQKPTKSLNRRHRSIYHSHAYLQAGKRMNHD